MQPCSYQAVSCSLRLSFCPLNSIVGQNRFPEIPSSGVGSTLRLESDQRPETSDPTMILRGLAQRLQHGRLPMLRARNLGQSREISKQLSSTEQHHEMEDFGDYSIILPDEPFVFGVSHIKPRTVPAHIARPIYAIDSSPISMAQSNKPELSKTIALGGQAEESLRKAANLARRVRDFAGTLARVCQFASLHAPSSPALMTHPSSLA